MAETKKKSQYNFGGHSFDTALYLLNLKDNAESFLNSKTDWTPEQKEEWKHSYTNFTNALLDLINNGTDRFSTDEFGTITDKNGEFSNTDSDNFYYNNKGLQISLEDYDKLKARKLGKYQTFEANRQFASYANLIGKGLRDALEAKKATSDTTEGFDYAKNGFASFWNKKYNPSGELVDRKLYWSLDKDGQYTNRVAQTLTDLDEYLKRDDLPDDVRANVEAYKNKLQEYSTDNKDFDVEGWKNGVLLAASRAGLGTWNNGFFNMGSQDSTTSDKKQAFDINNDDQALAYAGLTDLALAHPELRDTLLAQARRKYQQESQTIIDNDKAEQKLQLDTLNNKIWLQWLANEGRSYGDVSKRSGIKWYGNYRWSKNTDPEYQSEAGRLALKNLQTALAKTHWDSDAEGLFTPMKSTLSNGTVLNNLGEHLAYYLPMLRSMGAKFDDNFEEVTDNAGHKLWKVKNSKNKAGQYLYIWNKANGKLGAYRDVPFNVKKAEITKAFYGVKIQSREEKETEKLKENLKTIDNPKTPHELKVALTKLLKIGGNPFSDRATFLRTTALATDVGALVASLSGVGAPASAAIGAAATAQNLAADMAEGQGFWESLGNNAVGYGMDALSVLPFVRGIAGTGRIIKTASKLAPHIITALGAYSTLKNSKDYINSWNKITSNPSLLNRQDWSNIYDSLRLIISGTTAGTLAIKGNRAMKGAVSQDKVKVKTNEGYVTIDKSKLNDIKRTKGLEAQNKVLQQATGNNNLKFAVARNKYKFWKTKDLAKIKESEVYDFTKPNTRMINGVEYERPYKWGELGIANHLWQAPKWMNNILDRLETRGLKPTGRTASSIAYDNRRISPNYTVALLRELSNKVSPMVTEWNTLKTQAQHARKNAAEALGKARKATDPQIKNNYENSAKSYLDYIRSKATEYLKLKGDVKDGKITFDVGTSPNNKQIELAWNDILKKYGIKYKQGGSILKLANGDSINGNPWYSLLSSKGDYDVNKYKYSYDTNLLYAGDMSNGPIDFYVSNLNGLGTGRYVPTNNTVGLSVMDIENLDYYLRFGEDLLNEDGTFTPMGEKWAKAVDAQLPSDSSATFYDNTGKLRTKWTVKNNDSLNRPAETYTNLADYVKRVRNDQILGARHNVFLNTGNRYFYKDKDGVLHWVNPEDLNGYHISDKPVTSGWNDDKTVYWNDYELTGADSKINPADGKKPLQPNNFSVKDLLNKLDVTDKWGIPKAMYADITNRKVTDLLKKQPLLLDPQEDHRYIQSDLDAEMNGQAAAALLNRLASLPLTSDGNLQTAALLDAVAKGNEAITLGRQQSNLRLREMAELAWQLEVVNHTNRHNTAMLNRLSIYNTKNENNSLEAAYLNLKFTVWDALEQEKEFKAKSDYEQMRARADLFALGNINNAIKYGLANYADKYGLTPEDVSLWNKVYVDGTMRLDDVLKDPNKLKQWNKVLSATRLILQDLLGEYYGIPKSKYWTIRQSSYSPTITTQTTKQKKGGHLNLSKVREAAKGEKLAAALLKAQTADADRFYKTTKDHIDRMYNAINRLTNYSSTKKKRKKKSN